MSDSRTPDEHVVEDALREILDPLDRRLARTSLFLPLALVTVVPAVFFSFWQLGHGFKGVHALAMAGGVCCALVALHLGWEILASRLALVRFNRRFPVGSSDRAVALRMLGEMMTPSRAEEKLRSALAGTSADRIVRRPPASAATTTTTTLAEPSPLLQRVGEGLRRPGGYYDYIPLEPRERDPENPDEPRT